MPSPFPRYAPIARSIRFATVAEFDAKTWIEEEVGLVLVDMTIAEVDQWEWITETLPPTGQEARGVKVYLQEGGELLGIMLSVGSGWHVEHYDTVELRDFEAVPFPGPRYTARTERMALQQLHNARVSAIQAALARGRRRDAEYEAAREAEKAAELAAVEAKRRDEARRAEFWRKFAAGEYAA
ncbi:hypothetical protein [Kitasatospora aureofaciens]|uniref:hypothetical protein n=1 Tax=Kitasatospora aureofaciens TaxID=1894 RepID=UPI0033E33957